METPIYKKVLTRQECYIEFTEEERDTLNIKEGQKYTCELHDDGSIKLVPFAEIEIDLKDWNRHTLEFLIHESCEKDISVNEVLNNLLKDVIGEK